MKQFLLLMLTFVFASQSMAQTIYESPHVKDGKTIQITIPKNFYPIEDAIFGGNAMYCTKQGLGYDDVTKEGQKNALLAVLHEPKENQTIEKFTNELAEELDEAGEATIVIQKPTLIDLRGRDCMIAGIKGEMDGESVKGVYFGALDFGDYFIILGYFAREDVESVMDFTDFKKILGTWKEIATTKEDGMELFDSYEEEMHEMDFSEEDLETDYKNDLFETGFTYLDILPDFVAEWDIPMKESGHLLSEFQYKEDNGRVKIFSAGYSSDAIRNDEEKMAEVIQLAMEWSTPIKLKYESQFSNEDHVFRLFSISGGGTMTSVYTTVVGDELLFFVIDGGSNPADDFKPAVRDFMLTMWVDFVDEEEE